MTDNTKTFTTELTKAVKVRFKKSIFEEDFPDTGMLAWLVAIVPRSEEDCYELYFDFTEFEDVNDKYMKEVFYPNKHTEKLPYKPLYTAKESGNYKAKYSVFFGDWSESDSKLIAGLEDHLEWIEEDS